jgi:dihydrodipicolinate synthase/N-acetylneuraminate lyase
MIDLISPIYNFDSEEEQYKWFSALEENKKHIH